METTKIVYLEYKSDPISITLEAYAHILDIIENNRACTTCGQVFETDNPCVSLNKCLSCYLVRHPGFTFIGMVREGEYHNDYGYITEHGIVYTSYPGNDRQPERSDYYTLRHWGFTVPDVHTHKGQEQKLYSEYWHMYGDVVQNEAVVATYTHTYQAITLTCVLYKDGSLVELNKRSKENKELFKRAEQLAESMKDEHGYYFVDGYQSSTVNDAVLYRIISHIATEDYRTKVKENKQARVNELVHAWLSGSVDDNALFEIIDLYNQLGESRNAARFQMFLEHEPASVANDQNTQRSEA